MTERTMRTAIAVAVLCALAALAVMFAPTERVGADCGTWVSPELSDSRIAELGANYDSLDTEAMSAFGMDEDLGKLAGAATVISAAKIACDDALSVRRNLTIGLLGGVVLLPVGVIYVAGRSKRD